MNEHYRKPQIKGFTLVELLVVLVIISAMVSVILPYATRSNDSLRLRQECLNIAEAVKHAIDLSAQTERPTRILVDPENKCYWLEMADGSSGLNFRPVEGYLGDTHYLGRNIQIMCGDGFDAGNRAYYLLFDPAVSWPNAFMSVASRNESRTIKINGKNVEIEESVF